MKKKMLVMIATASLALTLPGPAALAADGQTSGLTRGQFFKQIIDELKLSPKDGSAPLPKDVAADSEHANTVRVLMERGIIDGYPDGTFRTAQPITNEQAGYVLGRFLGIRDAEALGQLKSGFGVSVDGITANAESAAKAIQSALKSDESALAFLEKAAAAQNDTSSFSSHNIQEMQMTMRTGESENIFPENPIHVTMESDVTFNKDKGMHFVSYSTAPLPGIDGKIEAEQFFVPEGSFMKMTDPVSKQPKWYNIRKLMPYGFKDMMAMQQNSMQLNKALMNKISFFYRDLGTEKQDGKTLQKIGVYGKISSFEDIMKTLEGVVSDKNMLSELTKSSMLKGMSMSVNSTVWIDEQTMHTEQMTADMSMKLPDTAALPIDRMDVKSTEVYKEYNAAKPIVLPDDAKNAPELPGLTQ